MSFCKISMSALLILVCVGSSVAGADEADVLSGAETMDVNVGSGVQVNAVNWADMADVNAGGNQLTGGGVNSNGGERISADLVMALAGMTTVTSSALDVEVKGNSIRIEGENASANSTLLFADGSGFSNNYGVTAVGINAGANSSQNVSVNIMSSVSISKGRGAAGSGR